MILIMERYRALSILITVLLYVLYLLYRLKKQKIMMPHGDPWYGFFYPTFTLIIDYYNRHGMLSWLAVQTNG